jgi:hypothetical protein
MYPAAGQFDGVMGVDGEGPGLKPSPAVSNNAAASPVTAAQSVNTTTAAGIAAASAGPKPVGVSSGATKSAPKPIDKSNWNRGTKVSQGTVDAVKDLGRGNMGVNAAKDAFALKPRLQGGVLSSGPAAASVEQKEATKRVYPNAYKNALINSGNADSAKAGGARSMLPTPAGKAAMTTASEASIANSKAPWNDKFAANIINAGKAGLEAYGFGAQNYYKVPK